MKRVVSAVLVAVLACGICGWVDANETNFDDLRRIDAGLPSWKLGRGLVNIVSGPHELFANMTNGAVTGSYDGSYQASFFGYLAGSMSGYIGGVGPGLYCMLRRMSVGCLEVLTFWKCEYGPTLDPIYGTNSKLWGNQDYFEREPFWYNGPSRFTSND